MISIVPGEISQAELHQYLLGSIGPRPICFAGTVDKEGNTNLAPFSFFNVFSSNPPIVVFSPARSGRDNTTKHTLDNAIETQVCTINVVNYNMVEKMNLASAPFQKGVSEYEKAGFTMLDSDFIAAKRVKESPVQLECRIIDIKVLGDKGGAGNLIIAEVLKIHVEESILDENKKIDPRKIDLVGRMGGAWYCRTTDLFQLAQPMSVRIGVDALPFAWLVKNGFTDNEIGKLGSAEELPTQLQIENEQHQNISLSEIKQLISNNQITEALAKILALVKNN